jgi:hypothetical protein
MTRAETGVRVSPRLSCGPALLKVGHQALAYELNGERLGKNTVYRLLPRDDIR